MTKFSIKTGLRTSFIRDFDISDWIKSDDQIQPIDGNPLYAPFEIGGDDYLHFIGLETFQRLEDADTGQRVSIFGDEIIVTDDLSGNPSRRRDAVRLYFCSENGPPVALNIIQHKGQTFAKFQAWDGKKPKI